MVTDGAADEDNLLTDMLLDWEDSHHAAVPKTLEQICGQRTDLVPELRRRIAALADFDRMVADATPHPEMNGTRSNNSHAADSCPELPGFRVLKEIGRGGMGIVYQAMQERLNRLVAIKTIRGGRWISPREIARFKGEAEILARLQLPGIVQIHDVVESSGALYLVLEFVNGQSLGESSRQATTTPLRAAKLALEIATTLAAVHAKGILHRDIKPANILLDQDGRVKLTDFGLAKELLSDSGNTMTGDVLGSPSYMAPEQATGNLAQISERTDVYAIGATLYELLTARPPFAGSSVVETLAQVKTQDPISPRQLVRSIPSDLETICLKCLEKDPSRRYASATLLSEDLNCFLKGLPIVARPLTALERGIRWSRAQSRTR